MSEHRFHHRMVWSVAAAHSSELRLHAEHRCTFAAARLRGSSSPVGPYSVAWSNPPEGGRPRGGVRRRDLELPHLSPGPSRPRPGSRSELSRRAVCVMTNTAEGVRGSARCAVAGDAATGGTACRRGGARELAPRRATPVALATRSDEILSRKHRNRNITHAIAPHRGDRAGAA